MNLKEFNNLIDLYFYQAKKENSNTPFLEWLNPKNKKKYTWGETSTSIQKLAEVLKKNLTEGDRCLLVSENRPEWLIADIAVMNAGGITVPIFTTYASDDYEYIVNDCNPSLVIISNNIQFKKIKRFIENKNIISFEKLEIDSILVEEVFKENKKDEKKHNLKRNSSACIIYTSGTTGNPKGVVLSHGGILSNCEGAMKILKPLIKKDPIFLTWLPLSHSYEHTVQFIQILVGAQIFYAESLEKLITNMSDSQPTIMTAVPRFYQNLYNKISLNFSKLEGLKKKLITNTLKLGTKKLKKENLNFVEKISNFLCEILVRKKIKKQFGGELQAFVSGGGALDQKIGEFLNSIGLPTLQGYGLTEASPVVSCNVPGNIQIETVGPPFKTNEVKISNDGEILVKGENVMLGYWNQPEETKNAIKEGWLYTGDIGKFNNQYLKITDRKKDIIVNAGGDNISPLKIENLLTNQKEIEQCLVYGDKKNYLIALIVPSEEYLNNVSEIKKKIEDINKDLSITEKIKKFHLIDKKFSIDNRMLTPTLKLKRFEIIKNYKKEIEKIYLK